MALPFALLLLLIAIAPMALRHHWERNYWWVAAGLGAITAGYYCFVLRDPAALAHSVREYVSFIALIGSLFIVASGIRIETMRPATPGVNALFLLIGAALANVIGTTGAAMLLIRPWIGMNKRRVTGYHVVFFIFIVANVGGCLTPIGDPPLFLGFLKGVPFWWPLAHLWPAWLVGVGGLIGVFFLIDRRNFLRAPVEVREAKRGAHGWRFEGMHNLLFLGMILAGVFLPFGARETLLLLAAACSWMMTPNSIHSANNFNLAPLKEVAWLFLGLFLTMTPALQWLEMHAAELGLRGPMQFYWLTGALSGVLDNAPTYLAFLATAAGLAGLNIDTPADVVRLVAERERFVVAISLGAVFFGAMTYIGNGPNFMVKTIAQQQRVETPGFLGYLVRFALPILGPLLVLIGLLFFSRWGFL